MRVFLVTIIAIASSSYCEEMDRRCMASIRPSIDGDSQAYQGELQECLKYEQRCFAEELTNKLEKKP